MKHLIDKVEKIRAGIAKKRDKLRELLSTMEELVYVCETAEAYLVDAKDRLEAAADELSKTQ